MYILVFLLCIHMQHLSENKCEVYELLTPKEDVQANKQALKEYVKHNFMHVSMFAIMEY